MYLCTYAQTYVPRYLRLPLFHPAQLGYVRSKGKQLMNRQPKIPDGVSDSDGSATDSNLQRFQEHCQFWKDISNRDKLAEYICRIHWQQAHAAPRTLSVLEGYQQQGQT